MEWSKKADEMSQEKKILVQFKNWISGEKSIGKKKENRHLWMVGWLYVIHIYILGVPKRKERKERKKKIYI